MKRLFIPLIIVVLLLVGLVFVLHFTRGIREVTIADFSRAHRLRVSAPFLPFRTGAFYIIARAQLTDDLTFVISDLGRGEESVPKTWSEYAYGGPEYWSNALEINIPVQPHVTGSITFRLYCGKLLLEKDRDLYRRFHAAKKHLTRE